MGIVVNPDSEYAKEMNKWEMFPNKYGGDNPPGRPYDQVKTEYPRMLYRAQKMRNGKYSAGEIYPNTTDYLNPSEFERAMLFVETFNRSCQLKVFSDQELERAYAEGWRKTSPEALDHAERLEQDMATAAAEAAFQAKSMSANAQREFKEAGEQTHEHVTDVVPVKASGKATTTAVSGSGRHEK